MKLSFKTSRVYQQELFQAIVIFFNKQAFEKSESLCSLFFDKMKIFVFFSGLFFSFSGVYSQTPLQKFVSSDNLSSAGISISIKEVETGKDIVEYHSKTNRNPASLTKLITTATALELLTDTFRFRTDVEYDGIISSDSVLCGNIYIRGGGDPTLESSYRKTPNNFYVKSVESIKNAGIRRISGFIIGDASCFEEFGSPFQWLVEDVGSYYSPTPSALAVHDNLFLLTLQSGTTSVVLKNIYPYTNLFSPVMNFKIKGKEFIWRVSKSDYSWQPDIRGVFPENKKTIIRTEIPEPALFAADSLRNLLQLVGIRVDSTSSTVRLFENTKKDRKVLFSYYSNSLKEIIKETNYRSLNLYAENIFNYLALQKDSIATSAKAASVISSYWKDKGFATHKIFQADGSGLSMKNAINADFFVQLLVYMKKQGRFGDSFVASLPLAGINGTVKSFLNETYLSGKVYAKSGSMERVQNYAGYIYYKNKWYAFCIMVNNYDGNRLTVRKQISILLNNLFPKE